MTPPPSPHDKPSPLAAAAAAGSRRPSPWPLVVGLSISAAVHLVVLLLYPVLAPEPGRIRGPAVANGGPASPAGTQVIRLVELPAPDDLQEPDAPEPPEPEEEERLPPPAPGPVRLPATGEEEAAPTDAELRTAAERLRPRAGDLRLWMPLPEDLTALDDEQRRKLDFALELAAIADSMAAAAEAARRATDWTFTDADGKRWGVSPGKIHLGDITLPLPFSFSAPYDPSATGAWQWEDLERSAGSAAARESSKDRAKAIRERVDRERARLRGGPVRPDTSGVGG